MRANVLGLAEHGRLLPAGLGALALVAIAARLGPEPLPYAWVHWTFDWKIAGPGPHQLIARATDDAGRTQPPGRASERVDTYEQNGYQTVHVMVT